MRQRRRDTFRRTGSPNVDGSATVMISGDRRRTSHNDTDRRRRRRHHSVNEAISHLDVCLPVRVGQDAARRSPNTPVPSGSYHAVEAGSEKPPPALAPSTPPVSVVVEDCPVTASVVDQPDHNCRPLPQFVDVAPRRTAAAASAAAASAGRGSSMLVGRVDKSRLGRRCRSLDNIHSFTSGAANQRTYALLMIAN